MRTYPLNIINSVILKSSISAVFFCCIFFVIGKGAAAETATCTGKFFPKFIEGSDCHFGLQKLSNENMDELWKICESSENICKITAIVKVYTSTPQRSGYIQAVRIVSAVRLDPASAPQPVVCEGVLNGGTLDSGVGDCRWLNSTQMKDINKIYKACSPGDTCRITGQGIKDDYGYVLRSVQSATRLRRAN